MLLTICLKAAYNNSINDVKLFITTICTHEDTPMIPNAMNRVPACIRDGCISIQALDTDYVMNENSAGIHETIPLYGSLVPAGFASPAEDYMERELDVRELLVTHPHATYFCRIRGNSMQDAWVRDGDIAVVDCSIQARSGHIAICVVDGAMLVKRLRMDKNRVELCPANPDYPVIQISSEQEFRVWGVVTWTLHPLSHVS